MPYFVQFFFVWKTLHDLCLFLYLLQLCHIHLQALYSSGTCHLISYFCSLACAGLTVWYVQLFFFFNIHLEALCKERRGLMKCLFVTGMNLTCTSVLQPLFCSRITCYMSPSFRLCAFFSRICCCCCSLLYLQFIEKCLAHKNLSTSIQ